MPLYEWPAEGDLHGIQQPGPISDPPTLKDLSNVHSLKHHLFLATPKFPSETLGKLVLLEHRLCQAILNNSPSKFSESQEVNTVSEQVQELRATLSANINTAKDQTAQTATTIEQKIDTVDRKPGGEEN
ncbi:hypothetical protein HGRIS_008205 [Hohenbuehelia grisea]|uniref:Uncharacterized protein n=1 Tax=Hohenbuehelia grisea TaxID=104357 RepID=A0ABR3J8Q1_9AGAR